MFAAILLLLVIAILFGAGFAIHALLWVATVLLVLWAIGWFIGAGAAAGAGRRHWYYW